MGLCPHGETNHPADAVSRNPFDPADIDQSAPEDTSEPIFAAAIRRDAKSIASINLDRVASETAKDHKMLVLKYSINQGFTDTYRTYEATACHWR